LLLDNFSRVGSPGHPREAPTGGGIFRTRNYVDSPELGAAAQELPRHIPRCLAIEDRQSRRLVLKRASVPRLLPTFWTTALTR